MNILTYSASKKNAKIRTATLLKILILTLPLLIQDSKAVSCHKCYRLEDCPKRNCTDIYGFVNTVYRQHFFIEPSQGLPICPDEGEELEWKKLEIDGECGAASAKFRNQPCSVSSFELSGPGLNQYKLNGVFLGCPKEFLYKQLLNKYDCTKIHRRFEKYRNGIVHPRNKFVELMLKLEQCRNNCSASTEQCDLCFGDGCVAPSNTKIRTPQAASKGLPITFAIFGVALFISVSAILAYFCEGDKVGRLDLVQSEDGSVRESLINNNLEFSHK